MSFIKRIRQRASEAQQDRAEKRAAREAQEAEERQRRAEEQADADRRGRRSLRVFILVLTAVMAQSVAGCSGQAAGTASPPPATVPPAPTSAAPTIAPTTAPTKAPASTPALPAPAELQGRWRAVIEGAIAILTFTATGYTQTWLGGGNGRIEVKGDEITFSGSGECPGSGTYRWSIEGDKLHLEPLGADPCPFRAEWARKGPYTRYD